MMDKPIGACAMEDCEEHSVCRVNAQWTIVDFIDYLACAQHVADVRRILARRCVDGQPPLYIGVDWFD
jgi:hypothetical protein